VRARHAECDCEEAVSSRGNTDTVEPDDDDLSSLAELTRHVMARRAALDQIEAEREREEKVAQERRACAVAHWRDAEPRVLNAVAAVNAILEVVGLGLTPWFSAPIAMSDDDGHGLTFTLNGLSHVVDIAVRATPDGWLYIPPPKSRRAHLSYDMGDGISVAVSATAEEIAEGLAEAVHVVLREEPDPEEE
jgi:hypothetical protein